MNGPQGRAKCAICDVDPKWKVIAGTYDFHNMTCNKYAQIGKGEPYQFCENGMSAFEAMFAREYHQPRLLLKSFLGNSARRWADSFGAALEDVMEMNAQLPPNTPCIFMTTAQPYSKKISELRFKAQAKIKRAFDHSSAEYTFVEGATPETV